MALRLCLLLVLSGAATSPLQVEARRVLRRRSRSPPAAPGQHSSPPHHDEVDAAKAAAAPGSLATISDGTVQHAKRGTAFVPSWVLGGFFSRQQPLLKTTTLAAYARHEDPPPATFPDDCNICGPKSLASFPYPCVDARRQKADGAPDHVASFKAGIAALKELYAFNDHKKMDWGAIEAELLPQVQAATKILGREEQKEAFMVASARVVGRMYDAHVQLVASIECESMVGKDGGGPDEGKGNDSIFRLKHIKKKRIGGGFGFTISATDAGDYIVTSVVPDSPAAKAKIQVGDVVEKVGGGAIGKAIEEKEWLDYDAFNPATAEHIKEYQVTLLTRAPVGAAEVFDIEGAADKKVRSVKLTAVDDGYKTLDASLPKETDYNQQGESQYLSKPYSELKLHELEGAFAYLPISQINFKPLAPWEKGAPRPEGPSEMKAVIQELIDKKYKGLLIDTRGNGGGEDANIVELQGYLNPSTAEADLFYEQVSVPNTLINHWCKQEDAMSVPEIEAQLAPSCAKASKDPKGVNRMATMKSTHEKGAPLYTGPVVSLTNGKCESSGEGLNLIVSKLPRTRAAVVGFSGTAGSFGMAMGAVHLSEYLVIYFPWGTARDAAGEILVDSDANMVGGVNPTKGVTPPGRIPRTKENVVGFQKIARVVDFATVKSGQDVEVNYALEVLEALAAGDMKKSSDSAQPALSRPGKLLLFPVALVVVAFSAVSS